MSATHTNWDGIYRATDYCLWLANHHRVLHIDRPAGDVVAALTDKAGLRQRAFIVTPCNPRSERLNTGENQRLLAAFREHLKRDQMRWLPSVNRDPDGDWPDEPGALIIDCSPGYARKLAIAYEQNAWVEISPTHNPKLIYA